MSERRVVITGAGWVTPLGTDVDAVWQRLLRGHSAIGPVQRYDAGTFATNFAAEVRDFSLERMMGPSSGPYLDSGAGIQFALGAASAAMRQARLGPHGQGLSVDPRRFGLYMGSGEGSLDFENFAAANLAGWTGQGVDGSAWARAAYARMSAKREIEQEPHVVISYVSRAFGLRGPAFNCMTACAASTQAVGEAFELIRHGDADLMLAGGSHSMIHPLGMTGFIRLTAMSTRRDDPSTAARPFDKTRDGFVMGEGAGMVVLEELDHAQKRGAGILAEVAGFGSTADAFRITDIQPEGLGAVAAIRRALRHAGIDSQQRDAQGRPPVQYISAHGTGTQENDGIETRAVKTAFGPLAPEVPFSSVKSMLGHLIQAAGAVELITCLKAIETGMLPPTINLHTPDPECDIDHVPNQARDMRPLGGVDVCLSNSFGFGGQNDTICVRKFRG
ncbi:MAG: beta-ketoacyl-[acyl-carrier-protein] synthase family protein [Leptolyngbya sp. PLA3]|nr:MAG: beta-ketoacyl-[acyl-carrier-protein] synthase family protein [Cyanobacteria bacterium CYA]MCE7967676.1 beta-ketoacyl-[acyl-carrier-protein] synthase family protein [Leptolyngbya sp. PL-A3]